MAHWSSPSSWFREGVFVWLWCPPWRGAWCTLDAEELFVTLIVVKFYSWVSPPFTVESKTNLTYQTVMRLCYKSREIFSNAWWERTSWKAELSERGSCYSWTIITFSCFSGALDNIYQVCNAIAQLIQWRFVRFCMQYRERQRRCAVSTVKFNYNQQSRSQITRLRLVLDGVIFVPES